MISLGSNYKIKGANLVVKVFAEYTNGYDTSCGLFTEDQLEDINSESVSYDSEHYTELPVNWHYLYVMDDRDKILKIKEIRHGQDPAYIMEDGYLSKEVTL